MRVPECHVLKLKKSIYGLKQSGLNWNNLISNFLIALGFTRCVADNCTFIIHSPDLIIIIIYVDDLIFGSRSQRAIDRYKMEIQSRFDMEDIGELSHYLGISVERDNDKKTILLSQEAYIQRLLQKFPITVDPNINTPLPADFRFDCS
jgi:hypothetical protein